MKSNVQHRNLQPGWLRLINWLGVGKMLARDWERRFPAVILASVLLALSVSYMGVQQSHLIFVLGCVLVGFLSICYIYGTFSR